MISLFLKKKRCHVIYLTHLVMFDTVYLNITWRTLYSVRGGGGVLFYDKTGFLDQIYELI